MINVFGNFCTTIMEVGLTFDVYMYSRCVHMVVWSHDVHRVLHDVIIIILAGSTYSIK